MRLFHLFSVLLLCSCAGDVEESEPLASSPVKYILRDRVDTLYMKLQETTKAVVFFSSYRNAVRRRNNIEDIKPDEFRSWLDSARKQYPYFDIDKEAIYLMNYHQSGEVESEHIALMYFKNDSAYIYGISKFGAAWGKVRNYYRTNLIDESVMQHFILDAGKENSNRYQDLVFVSSFQNNNVATYLVPVLDNKFYCITESYSIVNAEKMSVFFKDSTGRYRCRY